MKHYLRFMLVLLLSTVWCVGGYSQETVTDELTNESLGLKSSYSTFSVSLTSGAVYIGSAYAGSGKGYHGIQIRTSKSTSGIVTKSSVGKIKSISIDFNKNCKGISVYGKNTAYDLASELFNSKTQGDLIQDVKYSSSVVEITPSSDYKYVGFCSNDGTAFIDKITIVWEKESSKTPTTTTFGPKVNKQTFTITEGEPFPTHVATMTTAGVDGTIAYASDNNAAVKVDQSGVTSAGTGFGKAKITATFTPTDTKTYASSSAYYYIDYKEKTKPATAIFFDKSNVTLTTLDYASFTGQTAILKAGETILTNELTYSKEDAAGVITTLNNNDGTLVLSGNEGTATVTATFAGNDEYASSTASYTITVVDPNKSEVTFDFTDPTKFNYQKPESGNGIDLKEGATITSGIVTLKNVNNAQTPTRFFNSQGTISLRAYDGAKLSLSVPAGYYITKVVYVDDKKCRNFTCDSGYLKAETQTWTGNANSITMTFSGGQGQFFSMTISYTKSSEPEATSGTLEFKAVADGIYYATFSSSKNVVFPKTNVDVYSYNVTNGKGTQNILEENYYEVTDATAGEKGYEGYIGGYYVPANTGVLILSLKTTTPYYFSKKEEATNLPANQLKPAPADGEAFTAETGYKYYKLAYDNYSAQTGLGFYWGAVNGGAFKVKSGTAYLAVPTSDASNAKGFAFDGETNGIENVNVAANQSKTIYNLNGQRVSNMSQAGLYIVNGKKVVIRK